MRPAAARAAVAGLLLTGASAGCGDASPTTWTGAPPDGTRWVGMNGVVLAVPEWWTTGETQCLAPVETTVYFDQGATVACAAPAPRAVREVSALAVLDGRRGYGELLIRDMEPTGEVAGMGVVERDGCEEWFEGVCRRVFAVPEAGVVFAVTIHDAADGDYAAIRDSLRVLPEGKTNVPLASADGWTPSWGEEPPAAAAVVEAVEEAGLRAEVTTERPEETTGLIADLARGSLLDVQPAMGSVVDVGDTVEITVSGPRPRH